MEDISAEFRAAAVKFHGAGREDMDVRMLGRGRPFILEVQDAKVLPLARPQVRALHTRFVRCYCRSSNSRSTLAIHNQFLAMHALKIRR